MIPTKTCSANNAFLDIIELNIYIQAIRQTIFAPLGTPECANWT